MTEPRSLWLATAAATPHTISTHKRQPRAGLEMPAWREFCFVGEWRDRRIAGSQQPSVEWGKLA